MSTRVRTLFILPGPVPPAENPKRNRFALLSEILEGDVLQSVWRDVDDSGRQRLQYHVREFTYHAVSSAYMGQLRKLVTDIWFFVKKGKAIYRERPYEVIVCYGMTRTGLAGAILKLLTGAKLIIEVPGRPKDAFLTDEQSPGIIAHLKNRLTAFWCQLLFRYADSLRLFYPGQLEGFSFANRKKNNAFPDFVPLADISQLSNDNNYILFLGFPWYLKGVDLLIRAFRTIEAEFPETTLKIVGHCPDKSPFELLAEGSKQIELHDAVSHREAITLIENCSFLVLPSRTEGMPRVLVEAMAAKKTFVASKVGGIPHYLTHQKEGLLFAAEDVSALSDCMRALLSDRSLRDELGANGFALVTEKMSEHHYRENFRELVEGVLK